MANNANPTAPANANATAVVTEAERAAATADVDDATQAIAQQGTMRQQVPARGPSRPARQN